MSSPRVSIVLPTFNRAAFIPGAFASIAAQTFRDWELIVVDDGSTDDTRRVVEEHAAPLSPRQVHYIARPNGGPAAARNTGIARASGEYVAFFDSDDLWTGHHLAECVEALDANREVGWVFGAGRREEIPSGKAVVEHSFYRDGRPRPYMRLRTRKSGKLSIVDDPALVECVINRDHTGGLQASVIRRDVFAQAPIPDFRVGEDWALTVQFLAAGGRIGYFDSVHAIYRIHGDQISSAGAASGDLERRLRVQREYIRAAECVLAIPSLSPRERRAAHARLAREYFWRLGYAILWTGGRRREALGAFRAGLRHQRRDWRMWKTWIACRLRASMG